MIVANIADFREAARRRLPRILFEDIEGGSYAEVTLRRTVEDLAAVALRQRVLRNVAPRSERRIVRPIPGYAGRACPDRARGPQCPSRRLPGGAAGGADGIVVSNHGKRQLDGVLSTNQALPPIARAAADRLTVLADGGVRLGLDVVRLLALGAKGVLLGRVWACALAAAGESGVTKMLELIEAEMRVAMSLIGVRSIDSIDQTALAEGEGF